MDYYKMENIQSDKKMRESIAKPDEDSGKSDKGDEKN